MALNTRGIFHPKFTKTLARPAEGAMTASVLIRRVNPEFKPGFDFTSGMADVSGRHIPILKAQARIQPTSDVGARDFSIGNAMTVFQSVRIDIPMARRTWVNQDIEQRVMDGDQIVIEKTSMPALQALIPYVFTVRNPLNSSNAPQWNFLCDLDMKSDR